MKLFNTLTKKIVAAVTIVAAIAGITGGAIAGFGPDRITKVYSEGVAGFDYPVFNSFTNVPGYGDERNFLTGAYPNGTALTDPLAEVQQGDEITVQVLVHNNADPKYNADGSGFAKDTKVKVQLPTGVAKNQQAKATITASNTNPKEIFDTLDFSGKNGENFQIEYIPGSARIRGNYIDTALSDDVVGAGALIGTKDLNGVVKGCFGEEVLVTLKVKVKMPSYKIKKEVRLESEATTAYATAKNATLSDTLVWKVTFTNDGLTSLKNVQFIDPIPANMSVVPGTIKVFNANNPNGLVMPDTALQLNGRQIEINLGDYSATANAFVYFRTKTDRNTSALCGVVEQKNTAFVHPEGLIAISNEAKVTIDTKKTCEVVVVKECSAFYFTKVNRTTFDFTATANVQNATVTSYVFTATDKNGKVIDTKTVTTNATTANYRFVRETAGDYKVSAVINTDKGVATGVCEKTVTVTEIPATPVYSCDSVNIEKLGGRKVKISVGKTAEPSNRVQVKNYTYNFGDGSAVQTTDKNPNEYEYSKDGTYTVSVKVNFLVDGVMQTSTQKCEAVVAYTTPKDVCKYNPALAADDASCKPPVELPKTGGNTTLGMFIASTMIGMFAFRAYAVRKN